MAPLVERTGDRRDLNGKGLEGSSSLLLDVASSGVFPTLECQSAILGFYESGWVKNE